MAEFALSGIYATLDLAHIIIDSKDDLPAPHRVCTQVKSRRLHLLDTYGDCASLYSTIGADCAIRDGHLRGLRSG
jgi:hypothetical protein